jgi:hypothetical protein
MSRPRDVDEGEAVVLCRATEAGLFDELILTGIDSKDEKAAERAFDAECSRLLGRQVKVWQARVDAAPEDHKVWMAAHSRVEILDDEEGT